MAGLYYDQTRDKLVPYIKEQLPAEVNYSIGIQCPLDIATLDIAAALPIATSTPVTDLHHYINSNFVYNDLKFPPLFSK